MERRHLPRHVGIILRHVGIILLCLHTFGPSVLLADVPGKLGSFLEKHCIDCHEGSEAEGGLDLQSLKWKTDDAHNESVWVKIHDRVESGEMPPEEEKSRPAKSEVAAVTQWIEAELRKAVAQAKEDSIAPQARRLTNFEYENTIRDLIGFRLKLTDNLPKDPEKPYHFNNTAEFMLLGPEQVDRYLENARKVMASAIVDSAKPEARKARREWQPQCSGWC